MPRFASIWLDLGSELKILAGSMNGIDRRSVYRAANGGALARKNARERERKDREKRRRTSRREPRLWEAEWNHLTPIQDTSRSVLFPEVAPSDGQLWMLKIQLRGIYGCRRWAYLLSCYPPL